MPNVDPLFNPNRYWTVLPFRNPITGQIRQCVALVEYGKTHFLVEETEFTPRPLPDIAAIILKLQRIIDELEK